MVLPLSAMNKPLFLTLFVLTMAALLFAFSFFRPTYLADPEVLGILIIGQIVIACLCKYKQSFFGVVMIAFLWAGVRLQMSGAWLQGRWIVLAIGVLAGTIISMRERSHLFESIHLISFTCVLSAVVSATVSAYAKEALLKSLSLFLLFMYGVVGARLSVPPFEPEKFFHNLLRCCEFATYVISIAYFGLRSSFFGNPNSLGAVMGVVIIPVIFWGFLCAQSKAQRHRLTLELCLAATLLMSSLSRAGIAAALVSCLLIMIAQRQYRLILIVALGGVAIAAFAVTYVPRPAELLEDSPSQSIASLFLYKGKPKLGLLGSRRGPWEDTLKVIKAHPWFGSGFGTSVTGESATYFELTRSRFVNSRMVREHGNSYLAIAEWSGLLGVVPFYVLVGSVMYYAVKVLIWLQRTGNISSAAVPASAIAIAGLIGAGFEDWLFAAGYYLCVFFWANAFILADLVNVREAMPSTDSRTLVPDPQFAPSMVAQ